MNGRGGRGRARGAGGVGRLRQELTSLKHSVNGTKTTPPADPKGYVAIPWNSYTYERMVVTTAANQSVTIELTDVLAQLVLRIGLSSATRIAAKIRSAQCWATCGGSSFVVPDLTAAFHELANPQVGNTIRSLQRDKGTLQNPARAGYVYPTSDSKELLDEPGSGTVDIVTATGGDIGTYLTIRIQILWKANT